MSLISPSALYCNRGVVINSGSKIIAPCVTNNDFNPPHHHWQMQCPALSLSLKWPTSRTWELLLRRAMSWKQYNIQIQNAGNGNQIEHILYTRFTKHMEKYIGQKSFGCQAFKWVPLRGPQYSTFSMNGLKCKILLCCDPEVVCQNISNVWTQLLTHWILAIDFSHKEHGPVQELVCISHMSYSWSLHEEFPINAHWKMTFWQ